jgi:hypothetical protein
MNFNFTNIPRLRYIFNTSLPLYSGKYNMKWEAVCSVEIVLSFYQTTPRHIHKDGYLYMASFERQVPQLNLLNINVNLICVRGMSLFWGPRIWQLSGVFQWMQFFCHKAAVRRVG